MTPRFRFRTTAILVICLLALVMSACGNAASPQTGTNTPQAAATVSGGVFTPEDMQRRVDEHPSEYKEMLSSELAVLYAYPSPIMDWVGPIFLIHIPSVSEVVLDLNGEVVFKDYKSPQAEAALEGLLADATLIKRVTARANEIYPQVTEAPLSDDPMTTVDGALIWLLNTGAPYQANGTPEVYIQREFETGTALFYSYAALNEAQPGRVVRFSYLSWQDSVYKPDGDKYEFIPDGTPPPPVQFMTGSYTVNGGTSTPGAITFAGGLVTDTAVQQVRVTFGDGSVQTVPVENGAYLTTQFDVTGVTMVEGLNLEGVVLYWEAF